MDLPGRIAVVTGASSGIGAATAVALAERRATVVAVARREDRLAEVVARCRDHAPDSIAHPADVADREACQRIVDDTVARFGRLDVVVNNAGIPMRRHADDLTMEDVDRVTAVNWLAPVQLTLAALPGMRERGAGAIINVTSVAGAMPGPRGAAYGATKAALTRFTHGLAVDLADTGVHVGVVSPGPIDTEIWDRGAERNQYQGKTYPPEVVAQSIVRAIERERVQVTSPRHYGIFGALYPLVQRPLRAALVRWSRSQPPPPPTPDAGEATDATQEQT